MAVMENEYEYDNIYERKRLKMNRRKCITEVMDWLLICSKSTFEYKISLKERSFTEINNVNRGKIGLKALTGIYCKKKSILPISFLKVVNELLGLHVLVLWILGDLLQHGDQVLHTFLKLPFPVQGVLYLRGVGVHATISIFLILNVLCRVWIMGIIYSN